MREQTLEIENQEQEQMTVVDRKSQRRTLVPRVDIFETSDSVFVVADMPGVDETSIDISLEKDQLTIRGQVELQVPQTSDLTYAEYSVGDYARTFALGDLVDRDGITATLNQGVLRLQLPKSETKKTRKIAVSTEE